MTVHRATSNAKKGEPGHTVGQRPRTRLRPPCPLGLPGTARRPRLNDLAFGAIIPPARLHTTLNSRASRQGYEHLKPPTRVNLFWIAVADRYRMVCATIATMANFNQSTIRLQPS